MRRAEVGADSVATFSGVPGSAGTTSGSVQAGLGPLLPAAKRPRLAEPTDVKKPELPDEDATETGSRAVMKAIIPWVCMSFRSS